MNHQSKSFGISPVVLFASLALIIGVLFLVTQERLNEELELENLRTPLYMYQDSYRSVVIPPEARNPDGSYDASKTQIREMSDNEFQEYRRKQATFDR